MVGVLILEGYCQIHDTPAQYGAFQKYPKGNPTSESFNFSSEVGMMWYLFNNTQLDIQIYMSQCESFTQNPKRSHEEPSKWVSQFLNSNCHNLGHRLIMNPDGTFDADCYAEVDFLVFGITRVKTMICENRICEGYVVCVSAAHRFESENYNGLLC